MPGANGEVVVNIRANLGRFDRDMKKARDNASKFDKAGTKTSKTVNNLGRDFKKSSPHVTRWQKSIKKASDSAALLTGPLGGVASRLSILGRVTSVAGAAVLGFSLVVGGLTLGLSAAVAEAEKFERSGFKVQAVLKATGMSAGLTAKEIRDLSSEIALSTLASVEGVEAAATKLLTFRDVQGETFKQALKLSQDLAEIGFGSIEAGAVGLGKALQDPITGLTLLSRQGALTKAQQRKIADEFKRTGDLAKAQASIIEALNIQVGGAGVAAAAGLAGAYDTLGQKTSEFGQNLANNTGALSLWTETVKLAAQSVENLNNQLFDTPAERINRLLSLREKLQGRLSNVQERGVFNFGQEELERRIAFIDKEIMTIQDKRVAEIKASNAAKEAAKATAAAAEAERKHAAAMEIAAAEAERLKKLRESTITDLKNEINVLTALSGVYSDGSMTAMELAAAEERLSTLARLGLKETSAQGKAITDLIQKRRELRDAADKQQFERRSAQEAKDRIKGLQDEIVVTEMLTQTIGSSAVEINKAKAEVAAYRLEQQLLSETLRATGTLTMEQRDAIKLTAAEYGTVVARLGEVTAAQDTAREAAEKQREQVVQFQESLAEAMTDSIFSTESFEDSLKSMIIQMSRAVVQAQLLKAVQGDLSTGGGFMSGSGKDFGSSLISGLGSLFGGGGSSTPMAGTANGFSSVMASRMHTGGIGGVDGQRISSPVSNFIGAPKFHNGLKPNEFTAILEKGEAVIPKDKVGREGTARPVVNNFNITTPDADSFRMSQRQVSRKIKQATASS